MVIDDEVVLALVVDKVWVSMETCLLGLRSDAIAICDYTVY